MSRFGVVHTAFLALFIDYLELLAAAPGSSGLHVGLPADPRTVGVTLRMSFRTR